MQHEALYNCRLLLIEGSALEVEPHYEVAVGVGRNLSPGLHTIGPNTRFSGVHHFLKIPWVGR